jgi:hypothetical protein
MTPTPIGLDIGTSWIKAAQWARRGGAWRVRTAAWARRAPGTPWSDAEAADTVAILRRRGFTGVAAVLAAPCDKARLVEVEIPAAAVGPGRTAVARMEIARACRVEPAAFEFECWDLPKTARATEGAIAASVLPHLDADALVLPLDHAGLTVQRIAAPWSAFGAVTRHAPNLITGFVDLGHSALSLTVLVGGVCVYERRLAELGFHTVIQRVAQTLRADADHAQRVLRAVQTRPDAAGTKPVLEACRSYGQRVGEEIAVSLEYASHRYPHAAEGPVYALGGGACDPHMRAGASETAGTSVLLVPHPAEDLNDAPATPWALAVVPTLLASPPALAPAVPGVAA